MRVRFNCEVERYGRASNELVLERQSIADSVLSERKTQQCLPTLLDAYFRE